MKQVAEGPVLPVPLQGVRFPATLCQLSRGHGPFLSGFSCRVGLHVVEFQPALFFCLGGAMVSHHKSVRLW